METVPDFEDFLQLLEKHKVKYLIIGGLAFIFHAKPRYTKDIDILLECSDNNIKKANETLKDFGSPYMLKKKPDEILQLGLPPNRIDIIQKIPGVKFENAWGKRIRSPYGETSVNWIDIDSLIEAKKKLDHPRHKEDVRVLLEVKKIRKKRQKQGYSG